MTLHWRGLSPKTWDCRQKPADQVFLWRQATRAQRLGQPNTQGPELASVAALWCRCETGVITTREMPKAQRGSCFPEIKLLLSGVAGSKLQSGVYCNIWATRALPIKRHRKIYGQCSPGPFTSVLNALLLQKIRHLAEERLTSRNNKDFKNRAFETTDIPISQF